MKKIGLLLHPYGEDSPSGLGRAVFELARALIEASPDTHFVIYTKDALQAPLPFKGHVELRVMHTRSVWLFGGLYLDRSLDAYLFFTPSIPLFFRPRTSIVI